MKIKESIKVLSPEPEISREAVSSYKAKDQLDMITEAEKVACMAMHICELMGIELDSKNYKREEDFYGE